MNKLMDFCGSGEMLLSMLENYIIQSEIHKIGSGTKVTMMIFVEDDEQTAPCHEENDLKVSICDTMNLADSFLHDLRKTELTYGEKSKQENWSEADEERARVVWQNGNSGLHYEDSEAGA